MSSERGQYWIRMDGRRKVLEMGDSHRFSQQVKGTIRCNDVIEVQFYLNHEDKVYFDPAHHLIKITFE